MTEWFGQLPEPHLTIFHLLYVEGLRQRFAARKMGVSQPRVAQLHLCSVNSHGGLSPVRLLSKITKNSALVARATTRAASQRPDLR